MQKWLKTSVFDISALFLLINNKIFAFLSKIVYMGGAYFREWCLLSRVLIFEDIRYVWISISYQQSVDSVLKRLLLICGLFWPLLTAFFRFSKLFAPKDSRLEDLRFSLETSKVGLPNKSSTFSTDPKTWVGKMSLLALKWEK